MDVAHRRANICVAHHFFDRAEWGTTIHRPRPERVADVVETNVRYLCIAKCRCLSFLRSVIGLPVLGFSNR